MSLKQPVIAIAAAALFAVAGSASVSAQENCGFMYQRVMEAYQAQSPNYGEMLNYYNARCLSGSSARPAGTAVIATGMTTIAIGMMTTIADVGANSPASNGPAFRYNATGCASGMAACVAYAVSGKAGVRGHG